MIYRTIEGARVPALGLGTFQLTGEPAVGIIRDAIEIGYRLIDTAIDTARPRCRTISPTARRNSP